MAESPCGEYATANVTSLAENPSVCELLTYAVQDFKALRVVQKNAVLQHWAADVGAPESIVLTIAALWPPVLRARKLSLMLTGMRELAHAIRWQRMQS